MATKKNEMGISIRAIPFFSFFVFFRGYFTSFLICGNLQNLRSSASYFSGLA